MIGKNHTEGSIMRAIIGFSLPYLLAYFLQLLYGLADLFIVGQFYKDSVSTITAVALGSQVMHFVTVIVVGLAMGTTVSVAQAVGARNDHQTSTIIGNTITLFLALSILLATVLYLSVNGIVSIIATPFESIDETSDYLKICFLGIPAIVGYNIMASIFRGLGDSRTPMYFVAIACLINIAADYYFIGALHYGAIGAAMATVLAQACSVALSVLYVVVRKVNIHITRRQLHPQKDTMKRLFQIGLPVALQDGFIQVAFMIITVIANLRGLNDAAAVGIVEKIICFLFLVPSAMLSTVSALSAQNLGAGKIERARRTLHIAIGIAALFGVVASTLIEFYDTEVMTLFTSDQEVITLGAEYLDGYVWDTVFAGIHFCFSGYFCACNLSTLSFIHNMVSISIFRVPLAYLASINFPKTLFPMGLATVSGSVVSVFICLYFYYFYIPKKMKEKQ
jgi:putative MATE family efflux protein